MLMLMLALGCRTPAVPDIERPAEQVVAQPGDRFVRDGAPYSGHTVAHAPSGELRERASFLDGRRHGMRTTYFLDGARSAETPYRRGRRHGIARTWWPDGTLRSESTFVDGRAEGVHREWHTSGARFKLMNLDGGEEVGLQQAWWPDGTLYNNYEVRDGRAYGLQRSKRCLELRAVDVAASPR